MDKSKRFEFLHIIGMCCHYLYRYEFLEDKKGPKTALDLETEKVVDRVVAAFEEPSTPA